MQTQKVAILQLTRIGDLIQTYQATRQFKAENPNTHVTLIARRKFASGIMFLLETLFDDIILFDTQEFFKEKNFKSAKGNVSDFISKITATEYDFLINLSFNKSSSYLSTLINAKDKFGLHRNDAAEIAVNDRWSQFVYSNVMNSTNTPFSLVDIYRYIFGCNITHVLSHDPEIDKRSKNIVIHPFASQKKKRWGANKWTELLFKLASDFSDYQFYIVGSPQDSHDASRLLQSPALQKYTNRFHDLTKGNLISDCYQLLMDSRLFIGHDSMVSHLASETLTPTLILSLGTVRPHETSAYSEYAVNIAPKNKCFPCTVQESCELLPCHNSINHQLVKTIAKEMLYGNKINQDFLKAKLTPFHLNSVKIYTSSFNENTGLVLSEITENYKSLSEIFKEYYKVIWQYYLRDTDVNVELPHMSEDTASSLYNYSAGVQYLYELYNFGVKYSNKIIHEIDQKDTNFKEVQDCINKLGEIDQLCSITKKNYPHLTPLVDYFYVNKANALGNNIEDISKHNLLNYYDASNLVAVLSDFIEKSVKPYVRQQEVNKDV